MTLSEILGRECPPNCPASVTLTHEGGESATVLVRNIESIHQVQSRYARPPSRTVLMMVWGSFRTKHSIEELVAAIRKAVDNGQA